TGGRVIVFRVANDGADIPIGHANGLGIDFFAAVLNPHVDVRFGAVVHAARETPSPDDEVVVVPPDAGDAALPAGAQQRATAAHTGPGGAEPTADEDVLRKPGAVRGAPNDPGARASHHPMLMASLRPSSMTRAIHCDSLRRNRKVSVLPRRIMEPNSAIS